MSELYQTDRTSAGGKLNVGENTELPTSKKEEENHNKNIYFVTLRGFEPGSIRSGLRLATN